jgi:hypothetical protein
VPAFLYTPATAPLTVKFANFCALNKDEKLVFSESICGHGDTMRARGQRKNSECAHHGLDTIKVDDVIRIAFVDDCAHACVDDTLENWTGSTRPVAHLGEIVVHIYVGFVPRRLRADFGRHGRVMEIIVK